MKNYMTRRNNNEFWDNTFDDFFRPFYVDEDSALMKTDIKENEGEYLLDVEMPGFNKNDISLKFENGYLTVSAKKEDKQDEKTHYLRRERSVSCSRSYYMGDVDQKLIKAKYENGVLTVAVPKEKPEESNHVITID